MSRDKNKSGPGQISQAIVELDQKMQLLEHMKNGATQVEIMREMHIALPKLRELRSELLGELTVEYSEAVDTFRMVAYARYERLFKIADARARGVQNEDDEFATGIPDPKWFDRALAVLAAEAQLLKFDLDNLAKRDADKSRISLTRVSSMTLNASDPMAKLAVEAMQRDWLAGGDNPQETLLNKVKNSQEAAEEDLIFGEFPEELTLDSLEEQLKTMQSRLNIARGDQDG